MLFCDKYIITFENTYETDAYQISDKWEEKDNVDWERNTGEFDFNFIHDYNCYIIFYNLYILIYFKITK